MGLMDNLKKATGVGLTPVQHYNRAFEKGVLLGKEHYLEAAKLFEAAAAKAAEANDGAIHARATANAALYRFICTGDPNQLLGLRQVLSQLQDIEVIGTQNQTMPAAQLLAEVDARISEANLARISDADFAAKVEAHQTAASAFKAFFTSPLVTYRWQATDAHTETAQSRFFRHTAFASWHEAKATALADPESAAEHMAKALNSFRQGNDQEGVKQAQAWLSGLRSKRTCFICHREVQGADVHFKYRKASVSSYAVKLVERLGQDAGSINSTRGEIVLCTPCSSAIEASADEVAQRRANEVKEELLVHMRNMANTIEHLVATVNRLRR